MQDIIKELKRRLKECKEEADVYLKKYHLFMADVAELESAIKKLESK